MVLGWPSWGWPWTPDLSFKFWTQTVSICYEEWQDSESAYSRYWLGLLAAWVLCSVSLKDRVTEACWRFVQYKQVVNWIKCAFPDRYTSDMCENVHGFPAGANAHVHWGGWLVLGGVLCEDLLFFVAWDNCYVRWSSRHQMHTGAVCIESKQAPYRLMSISILDFKMCCCPC